MCFVRNHGDRPGLCSCQSFVFFCFVCRKLGTFLFQPEDQCWTHTVREVFTFKRPAHHCHHGRSKGGWGKGWTLPVRCAIAFCHEACALEKISCCHLSLFQGFHMRDVAEALRRVRHILSLIKNVKPGTTNKRQSRKNVKKHEEEKNVKNEENNLKTQNGFWVKT